MACYSLAWPAKFYQLYTNNYYKQYIYRELYKLASVAMIRLFLAQ